MGGEGLMIALVIATILLQGAAQPPSSQCLIEIAALSGDQLDIRDSVMREAANQKADRLLQIYQRGIAAVIRLDDAQKAYAATLPAQEEAGEVPPGFAEAAYQQYRADRGRSEATARSLSTRTPSCTWPQLPPPIEP